MLTKALLITRMACVFIDHIIRRMEQAELIETSLGEPHLEWENQYRNFLLQFLRVKSIPDRREIVKLMQRLHRYTVPPPFLLDFRRRMEVYAGQTAPLLFHYENKGLLVDVEGTGSVDEVRQRMFDMVDAHAGANR